MSDIKRVLSTVPYAAPYLARVREIYSPAEVIQVDEQDSEGNAQALTYVDTAFIGGDLDDRYLSAPNLKWIHCGHAGLNKFARKEIFDRGLLVTSSAGRSAPALAEHIIMFMLALAYQIERFITAQRAHVWGIEGQDDLRGLYGKSVGIIGMGNNGTELAVRAKAMGMRVLAFGNRMETPANTDVYYSAKRGDVIDALLRESDYVALCVPLTNETYHMISTREFKLMKPTACIVNMARGAVIDEQVLIQALREGWIAGAGLDTFEEEPLSADSGLWDLPNVYMTPHCTPQVPDRTARTLDILQENVRRYRAGEPLRNQMTERDIFSK